MSSSTVYEDGYVWIKCVWLNLFAIIDLRRFGGSYPPSSKEIYKDVIENYETLLARSCAIDIQLGQLVISQIYQLKK